MEPRDTSFELNSGLLVATDAKGLVQQGGGHVRSLKEDFRNLLEGCHVHALLNIPTNFDIIRPRAQIRRMSLEKAVPENGCPPLWLMWRKPVANS
jgi:hypothetical protein